MLLFSTWVWRGSALRSLGAGAASLFLCACVGAGGDTFTLDLRLSSPSSPDPFADIDLVQVDLAYADGSEWSVYWSDPSGSADFEGVPAGEGVVLTVTTLRWDGSYADNALPIASGSTLSLDLEGDESAQVLVAVEGRVSQMEEGLAVAREGAEILAFSKGTVVVVGGQGAGGLEGAVSSLEVARVDGRGAPLRFSASGELARAWMATASGGTGGDVYVVWGGTSTPGVDPFDGASGEGAVADLTLVREGGEVGTVTLESLSIPGLLPRLAGAAATLEDGRVVAVGGLTPGEGGVMDGVFGVDLLDVEAGQGEDSGSVLAVPRAFPRAVSLGGGGVLVVGGWDAAPEDEGVNRPVVAEMELFREGEEMMTVGTLAFPRVLHDAVVVAPGRLLVMGGLDGGGERVAEAEMFTYDPGDPAAGMVAAGTFPLLWPRARGRAVVLGDETVLLCGGEDQDGPVDPCERFLGEDAGFVASIGQDSQGNPVYDGMNGDGVSLGMALLPNGMVLMAGGSDGAGTPSGSLRVFNP